MHITCANVHCHWWCKDLFRAEATAQWVKTLGTQARLPEFRIPEPTWKLVSVPRRWGNCYLSVRAGAQSPRTSVSAVWHRPCNSNQKTVMGPSVVRFLVCLFSNLTLARVTWKKKFQLKKHLHHIGLKASLRGVFGWLMWVGPAYSGVEPLWAGGPGLYKKAGRASHGE